MAFPHSDLQIKVYAYLGADPTADPSTWPEPVDLSSRLLKRDIGLRTGRQPGQRTAAAGQLTLWLDNEDGELTPLMVTSQYYPHWDIGVPMAVDVELDNGTTYGLIRGNLAGIKADIIPAAGGPMSAVQITVAGIIRQLSQGAVAKSAMLRTLTGRTITKPTYHWALESDPSAGSFLPTVGTRAITIDGDPGYVSSTEGPPGAAGAVRLECYAADTGAPDLAGRWSPLSLSGLSSTKISIAFGFKCEFADTPTTAAWRLPSLILEGGTHSELRILAYAATTDNVPNGNFGVDITLDGSQQLVNNFATQPNPFDGLWHSLLVMVEQDGSDVVASAWLDGKPFANTLTGGVGKTLGRPIILTTPAPWNVAFGGSDDYDNVGTAVSISHLAIWSGDVDPLDLHEATTGYAGETASERIARVFAEEGIPFEEWLPAPTHDIPLGPQPVGTPLDVARDAELAGHGILYESTRTWALGYRPLQSRYHQPASLVIDLAKYRVTGNTGREVLQPVRDDARLRNEWTVSRPGGPSVTLINEAHQKRHGRFDDSITVNVAGDDALSNEAGWRVHEGTFGGLRYSSLSIDLGANPNLITPWLLTRLGDRIDRVNHSGQHPTGTVSLALEGYSATIRPREWQIQANVEPYKPWETPQYVGPNGGRLLPMSGSVSTTGAGSQVNLDFTGLSVDFRGERPKMLRLVLEVDDPDELGNISLFLGVGGLTNHIRWLFHVASTGASAFLPGQRTAVILQLSEIHSVGGSITLSPRGAPSVMFGYTHARLAVTDKGNGQPVTVTLHSAALVSASDPGPFVSITFDDGLASVSSLAWPKMRELGLRGTEYPIVEVVGDSGRVTLDELRERYEAGWEIGGHSYAATVHTGRYTGVNAAQALADMQANIAWLEQHFPARAYTMAYPGGEFTETIDGQSIEDIIVAAGYAAARTTLSNPGSNTHLQIESMPPPIMTRLYAASGIWDGASGQQNPANLLATGGMLDRVEALGGWLILVFHDIVEGTPTNSLEVSKADFDAIMESLASRAVTVLPVREVLALLPKRRAKYQVKGCSTIQGLWLRGASDSYVSTPSAAPLQITGDLDVRAYIRPASWTPATAQHIVSKDNPSGNQRGYRLQLNTDGTISLAWSPNGVDTLSVTSTAAPTVGAAGARAIRAVLDVNNGSGGHTVTFYEAATLDGPWTQLGSSGSDGSGTTSIFASTAELRIGVRGDGTQPFEGVIHAVEIRSGIDGTVVADPDFTDHDTGDTSISDDAGNTWTVQANAEIVDSLDTSNLPSKLMVVTTAGPTLTTDSAQMPLYIECAGVELEVTEVEGTGRPQVLTVTSASVPKTIGPGETVTLSDRPVYAL